ncbi:hypothetical protein LL061_08640 [Escherichia coli]|uniref:hypothetical protein n=1 Tax=Escherichia coli TaxID=562 RepID=UPI001D17ED9E|nr:hypothetical protein [Escherichia coli]MCC4040355.1 hypothetical protein [Escherichia coli]
MADLRSNAQMFDIDVSALEQLKVEISATQHQMLMAYNRALNRTAKHMHRISVGMIIESLAVKGRKAAERRIKPFVKRRTPSKESIGDLSSVKLWYGLNDFRVHNLKGRMQNPRKQKQPRDPETGMFLKTKKGARGATFIPKSAGLAMMSWPDSFVAKRYGEKSIWLRRDRGGIEEARVPVHEALEDAIGDYIFENIGPVFMGFFEQDLRGRVKGNVHVDPKTGKRL